ncbi:MAG: hypothetical protein QNJ38_02070 [Prochloraceae cyanobacterium]|nr:hypothetical protein [Prochloraceae cyanobacterium]
MSVALPFQEILASQIIEEVIDELEIKYRNRLYNPVVIIWSFLSQVLDNAPAVPDLAYARS